MTVRKRFDTYGFVGTTLEEARALVERVLGEPLQERESGWLGKYYATKPRRDTYRESLVRADVDKDPTLRERYDVLLTVENRDDMDAVHERLLAAPGGPELIRSNTLEIADDDDDDDDDE